MLDRSLLLVSGKGGVGKSAFTAALSILAARRGRSVLAMSMVDDLGLATHLGRWQKAVGVQAVPRGSQVVVLDQVQRGILFYCTTHVY